MRASMSWLAKVSIIAVLAFTQVGCLSRANSEVPTHTLAVGEAIYEGYLVPHESRQLGVDADNLARPVGSRVAAGETLTNVASREQAAGFDAAAAVYADRVRVADAALAKLRSGSLAVTFKRNAAVASADVRSAELEVDAALITQEREALQRKRDNATPPESAAERSFRQADERLAAKAAVVQIASLFERLRDAASTAHDDAASHAAALQAKAPWPGTVVSREGGVWLDSATSDFVYVATERQVDELVGAADLQVAAGGQQIATTSSPSVAYNSEATTSPASPRFTLRFPLTMVDAEYVARDHATASIRKSGTHVIVPADFLGHDEHGTFVRRGGERVAVEIAKDSSGNNVVVGGEVAVGDRVEKVSA